MFFIFLARPGFPTFRLVLFKYVAAVNERAELKRKEESNERKERVETKRKNIRTKGQGVETKGDE